MRTEPGVQMQAGDVVQTGVCKSIRRGRAVEGEPLRESRVGPASGCLIPSFSSVNSDEVVVLLE